MSEGKPSHDVMDILAPSNRVFSDARFLPFIEYISLVFHAFYFILFFLSSINFIFNFWIWLIVYISLKCTCRFSEVS